MDTLNSVPNSKLQFYDQHAVQAIRAKFIKIEYITEELDGFINGKIEIPGLIDLYQAYIKSDIIEELIINRNRLIARLRAKEKTYIINI